MTEASSASTPVSPGRRIARHTGWLLSAHVVATVLLALQAILTVRALGPTRLGIMALVVTYVLTIRQLLDFRVWEPILKFVPQYQAAGRHDRASGIVLLGWLLEVGTALLTVLIVTLTASVAARWLTGDAAHAGLFRLYAWSAVLGIPAHPIGALLRLADRPSWLSVQRIATTAVQLAGTILVILRGVTLEGLLIAQLAGILVGSAVAMVLAVPAHRLIGLNVRKGRGLRALRGESRTVAHFCLMTNLTGCSRVLSSRADTLILGWLTTPAVVGFYDLARLLASQALELFGPLHMSILPEMSIVAAHGREEALRRLRRQLTRVMLALVIPICLLTTVAAPWIMPIVFGVEYGPSVILVQILIWQLLWLPVVWIPSDLLIAGRPGLLMTINWIGAALLIALLLVLVPMAGGAGAAISLTSYQLAFVALAVWAYRRARRDRPTAGLPANRHRGQPSVAPAPPCARRPHRSRALASNPERVTDEP